MAVTETVPVECQGVDFDNALERLPARMGELFFSTGEQRLRDLDQAMQSGDAAGVMDAAHALASLTGLLNIKALSVYARDIYAAAERGELAAAGHAHQRLGVVLGWALEKLRAPKRAGSAS
jgi:Hpt domain.